MHLCWILLIFQDKALQSWISHFICANIKIIWDKFWNYLFPHFEVSLAQVVKKTGIKTATQVWGMSSYLSRCFYLIQLLDRKSHYLENSELPQLACSSKVISSLSALSMLSPFHIHTSPPDSGWVIHTLHCPLNSFFLLSFICLMCCVAGGLFLTIPSPSWPI